MELKQLRFFLAVCRHGSIAQAAQALHIAQPALSRQIAALESTLGQTLFMRGARGVRLTRAGEELELRAEDILARATALSSQLQVASHGLTGRLRIGVLPGYAWLPELVQAIHTLRRAAPQVQVVVETLFSADQLTRLARHELDIAIVGWRSPFNPDFIGRRIHSDRLILALPRTSPLARKRGPLRLADIAQEQILMFPRDRSPTHYDALADAFAAAGLEIEAHTRMQVMDIATATSMVASGLGCAFVPGVFRQQWAGVVAFKEVVDCEVGFTIEVVRHAGRGDGLVERFWGGWGEVVQ